MALQVLTAASGALRDAHKVYDPLGVLRTATLLEGQRTNLLLRSQEFGHAAWVSTAITVTSNTATAPDGTVTADTLAEQNSLSRYSGQVVTVANDTTTYTASVFVKSALTPATACVALRLVFTGGTTIAYGLVLDLETGNTIYTTGASDATPTHARAVALGGGWYRIEVTGPNNGSGNTNLDCRVYPAWRVGTASGAAVATATGNVYAWGAQAEAGEYASSYIATTSGVISRQADLAYYDTATYGADHPLVTPQESWMYFDFIEGGGVLNNGTRIAFVGALGTSSAPRWQITPSGGTYRAEHHNGTIATVAFTVLNAPAIGQRVRLLAQLYDDGSVVLYQRLGDGAVQATPRSVANALAGAWATDGSGNTLLGINSAPGGAGTGRSAYLRSGTGGLATIGRGIAGGASATAEQAMAYAATRHAYEAA